MEVGEQGTILAQPAILAHSSEGVFFNTSPTLLIPTPFNIPRKQSNALADWKVSSISWLSAYPQLPFLNFSMHYQITKEVLLFIILYSRIMPITLDVQFIFW